ncbi:MAG: hypothetical protein ABI678_18535 [Kofleriaceae bacterium]
MRRSRRRHTPPDLTSLFDVLFIVIFAALIRAAASQAAAAHPPSPPVKPAPAPLDPASLHARAVAEVDRDLAARDAVILRISIAGTVTALEHDHVVTPLDVPLLEHDADPDVAISYLGERSAELRLCRIAALHVGATDLSQQLVIFAPAAPLADLPHALFDGLHRDVERCLNEQHGLAVVVEP